MFVRLLWLFLFFSSAHAIPQYTLTSIDMTKITLDNQAVFQTDVFHQQAISNWIAGDILELSHGFISGNFLMSTQLIDGLLVIVPAVQISNITRNSEAVAHLIALPEADLLRVSSINLSNYSVALSDATNWTISSDDRGRLNMWNVDDEVFVGYNIGLQNSIYEAVLLNARQQSVVKTHQQ